jgi:hypothetical protein
MIVQYLLDRVTNESEKFKKFCISIAMVMVISKTGRTGYRYQMIDATDLATYMGLTDYFITSSRGLL